MKKTILATLFGLGLISIAPMGLFGKEALLKKVESIDPINSSNNSVFDRKLWNGHQSSEKQALLTAIDGSLRYLDTPSAAKAYRNYPVSAFTQWRVRRSLVRFRELLTSSRTPEEFQAAIEREFAFYRSTGNDGRGTVLFTGYFQPVYAASRTPTAEYRYPIYRQPSDFDRWSQPHPTRLQLEGKDGLLAEKSSLAGLELVWLRDRLEAFLIQVQGSAQLQLSDGTTMTVGYDGSTAYPYTSLGRALVDDGKFKLEELTLPIVLDYFRANPSELDKYIPRNQRFVFFRETDGAPPTGSLNVPVIADRSIATDKSIMPPGALALINTKIPYAQETGKLETREDETLEAPSALQTIADDGRSVFARHGRRTCVAASSAAHLRGAPRFGQNSALYVRAVTRYVLDQDTGSAIKGAGRVDIFLGSGKVAGDRAGILNSTGELYYLLLKD